MFVTYPFSHEVRGERATAAYQTCLYRDSPESPNFLHNPLIIPELGRKQAEHEDELVLFPGYISFQWCDVLYQMPENCPFPGYNPSPSADFTASNLVTHLKRALKSHFRRG